LPYPWFVPPYSNKQTLAACYFPAGAAPASLVVQNPVSGVVNEQTHLVVALMQGWVMLQVPLHVSDVLASARNWRAETVPAQRTAVIKTASNAFFVVFMLIIIFLSDRKIVISQAHLSSRVWILANIGVPKPDSR
jgi:hypothetical protein